MSSFCAKPNRVWCVAVLSVPLSTRVQGYNDGTHFSPFYTSCFMNISVRAILLLKLSSCFHEHEFKVFTLLVNIHILTTIKGTAPRKFGHYLVKIRFLVGKIFC